MIGVGAGIEVDDELDKPTKIRRISYCANTFYPLSDLIISLSQNSFLKYIYCKNKL